MNDGPEWFAAKRYGWGAGLPIAWQGWALSAAYGLLAFLAWHMLREEVLAFVSVLVPLSVIFMTICARTTRGGWHWRWGRDD